MKKILHIIPYFAFGGMELATIKLINNLPEIDHYFCIMYSQPCHVKLLKKLNNNEIKYVCLNKKEGIDTSLFKKISRYCIDNKIEILHCRNFASTLYGCGSKFFYLRHLKIVSDIRSVELKYRRQLFYRFLLAIDQIDKLIAVSKDIRTRFLKFNLKRDKVVHIPNGIERRFADNANGNNFLFKKKLGIENKIVIGSVGRIVTIKNYPLLLNVFRKILKKFEQLHLVLVGDGSELDYLKQLSYKLGIEKNISFLGYQKDVYPFLKAFDIFVNTSFSEGLSNAIMEAMNAKCPVVATKVGGTTELITDEGNGFVFPSGNNKKLELILERLIKDPQLREKIGNNACQFIRKNYSVSVTKRKYLQLYNNITA